MIADSPQHGQALIDLLRIATTAAGELSALLPKIIVTMRETLGTVGKDSSFDSKVFLFNMNGFNSKQKQLFQDFLKRIEAKLKKAGKI